MQTLASLGLTSTGAPMEAVAMATPAPRRIVKKLALMQAGARGAADAHCPACALSLISCSAADTARETTLRCTRRIPLCAPKRRRRRAGLFHPSACRRRAIAPAPLLPSFRHRRSLRFDVSFVSFASFISSPPSTIYADTSVHRPIRSKRLSRLFFNCSGYFSLARPRTFYLAHASQHQTTLRRLKSPMKKPDI